MPARVGPVDRGQRLRRIDATAAPAAASSRVRWILRTIVSPADEVADQIRIAQGGRGIVGGDDLRDRGAGGRRARRRAAASNSMPACTSSGGPVRRIRARAPIAGLRIEGPGGAAGPAGEHPQVGHR